MVRMRHSVWLMKVVEGWGAEVVPSCAIEIVGPGEMYFIKNELRLNVYLSLTLAAWSDVR